MDPITLSPSHRFPAQSPLAASSSPFRSPSRWQHLTTQEFNNSLSELSPSSTLEALQASDILRPEDRPGKSFIQESVAAASTSERAWGIKAALAGKRVQEWYAEIGAWAWPGFDHLPIEERANTKGQHDQESQFHGGLYPKSARPSRNNLNGKQAIGAFSWTLVQEYEGRLETIKNAMEALEIEDLKDYLRSAHWRVGSKRSSIGDSQADFGLATGYEHLDDFTAIITATIVQALPTISRLETLLSTWSTRLVVLRQVSSFLFELESGRESMVSASIAIGTNDAQQPMRKSEFSRKAFLDIRAVLQDQIAELGRKLDRMLDLLEGSADTLPDAWIDSLDDMENQYSAWVMRAEHLAMNKELRNERLEKDYTQDHSDEILDLDMVLGTPHMASNSERGARLNESRPRADGGSDVIRQDLVENLETEDERTESSSKSSTRSFGLEPVPSRNALLEQLRAQLRRSLASSDNVDGLPDRPKTPLPVKTSHRPASLMLAGSRAKAERPHSQEVTSDSSSSEFSASNYSSNTSSPKIQSAVVAEYIGTPLRVRSPVSLSKEAMTSAEIVFRRLGPPAGGDGARSHQNGVPSDLFPNSERSHGGLGHFRARSASLQSFELVPKHEIRRIRVQRSGSYSSALSLSDPEQGLAQPSRFPPPVYEQHGELEALRNSGALPASREAKDQQSSKPAHNQDLRPDTPKRHPHYHTPPPISVASQPMAQSQVQGFHTPRQQLPYHPPPPVPARAAHRFEQVSDLSPGSTPVNIRQTKMNNLDDGHGAGNAETPQRAAGLTPRTLEDQLEERISSILTELPTQIRLTSGPEPDAPEVTRFNSPSDAKTSKVRLPAWRLKRRQTSNPLPSMTLAPAQPKNSQSRSPTTEPDIKLYHLHQAGRTAPIKLFVRLVGEGGERVMVRIGGGWADLAEYLREYAGHHGHRSVSDTPFDITGLPNSSPLTNNQSPRSRPGSRPLSRTSSTKPSPATRLARQQTSPAIFNGPHTPQSDPSTRNSPRLSWAGTEDVSPSLGLAGPKTKNVDISPRKQAWVDEMMEKARLGGVEKKKGGDESVVGELGKVGRTRRVFFKSRKDGYTAGGSFQDALAQYRTSRGLPAVSIDLGMVKSVGYVAEATGVSERLAKIGYISVEEDEVLRTIESAIETPNRRQRSCQVITGLGSFTNANGILWREDPRFRSLQEVSMSGGGGTTNKEGNDFKDLLAQALSWADVVTIVTNAIVDRLSEMFLLPPHEFDSDQPVSNYGVDSLVAVELRNWLVGHVQADTSIFDVLQSTSISVLASKAAIKSRQVAAAGITIPV